MSLHQDNAKLDDPDLEQTMENASAQETLGLILEVGKEFNREIRSVGKHGLYCVALNPRMTNARQKREVLYENHKSWTCWFIPICHYVALCSACHTPVIQDCY